MLTRHKKHTGTFIETEQYKLVPYHDSTLQRLALTRVDKHGENRVYELSKANSYVNNENTNDSFSALIRKIYGSTAEEQAKDLLPLLNSQIFEWVKDQYKYKISTTHLGAEIVSILHVNPEKITLTYQRVDGEPGQFIITVSATLNGFHTQYSTERLFFKRPIPITYDLIYDPALKALLPEEIKIVCSPSTNQLDCSLEDYVVLMSKSGEKTELEAIKEYWSQLYAGFLKQPAISTFAEKLEANRNKFGFDFDELFNKAYTQQYADFFDAVDSLLLGIPNTEQAKDKLISDAEKISHMLSFVYHIKESAQTRAETKQWLLVAIEKINKPKALVRFIKDFQYLVDTDANFYKLLVKPLQGHSSRTGIVNDEVVEVSRSYADIWKVIKRKASELDHKQHNDYMKTNLPALKYYQRHNKWIDKGLWSASAMLPIGLASTATGAVIIKGMIAASAVAAIGVSTAGIGLAVLGGIVLIGALSYILYCCYKHSSKAAQERTVVIPANNEKVDDTGKPLAASKTATLFTLLKPSHLMPSANAPAA